MAQIRTLPTPLALTDFDVGVTLGTGSFGRVRFSTHRVSCIDFIICNCSDYDLHIIGHRIILGCKDA